MLFGKAQGSELVTRSGSKDFLIFLVLSLKTSVSKQAGVRSLTIKCNVNLWAMLIQSNHQ